MKKETIIVNANELKTLVKECRLAKGITQTELAKLMKTSRQNIYAMETGRHSLGLKKTTKVIELLGGSVKIIVTI